MQKLVILSLFFFGGFHSIFGQNKDLKNSLKNEVNYNQEFVEFNESIKFATSNNSHNHEGDLDIEVYAKQSLDDFKEIYIPQIYKFSGKPTLDTVNSKSLIDNLLQLAVINVFRYNDYGLKVYDELDLYSFSEKKLLPNRITYFTYENNLRVSDTIYRYDIMVEKYLIREYNTYEYPSDLDNGVFTTLKYQWSAPNNEFFLFSKNERLLVDGRLTRNQLFLWDDTIMNYRISVEDVFEYEGNNISAFKSTQFTNEGEINQSNGYTIEYENGFVKKRSDYNSINDKNEYRIFREYVDTRDGKGLLILRDFYSYDYFESGFSKSLNSKTDYEYNDKNLLAKITNRNYNFNLDRYVPVSGWENFYDDYNNLTEEKRLGYNIDGSEILRSTSFNEFNYDYATGEYISEEYASRDNHMMVRQYRINHEQSDRLEFDRLIIYKFPTVNTSNEIKGENVEIFPNPATNLINIKTENSNFSRIDIYNNLGVQVYSNNLFQASQINIDYLSNGIYYIKLTNLSGGEIITKKFIKQ